MRLRRQHTVIARVANPRGRAIALPGPPAPYDWSAHDSDDVVLCYRWKPPRRLRKPLDALAGEELLRLNRSLELRSLRIQ